MAKRLIDADAMFQEFERAAWYDNADRDEIAESILLQMPTVEAVEVVRCRDCRMFVDNKEARVTYCRRCLMDMTVRPDAFCSYGERKEK